jgi:signal transduction histidine kinase
MDSAYQGQEGLEKVKEALAQNRPFALAFVDVRMPPGWDGVQTVEELWKVDPRLQIVLCTAYSDYSWDEMRAKLKAADSVVVLKKPFDNVEVLQLTHALLRKWELTEQARARVEDLDRRVAERTRDLQLANERLQAEIAERARVEETLRQAQKMEAVGQLAAGIAHDFNNLLTIIQGQVDLLLRQGNAEAAKAARGTGNAEREPDSAFRVPRSALEQVALAAERAASLTRQLLVFSRKHVPQLRPVDLNRLLNRTGKLLTRLLGEQIQLHLDCAPGLPPVTADECNLDQVLMNLAVNARDAMPGGGTLTLATSFERLTAETARAHPKGRPGAFVCVRVTDTGSGMDAATLARLFEPFFTTKDVGKGTGLGLATVYGILQHHQGWIEVASQPGQGSTFQIFLPCSERPAPSGGQTEFIFRSPANAAVRGTILVAEDEPVVRQFARTLLETQAFQVLEAADGVEALKVWSENRGQIDLLFTDMVMPNGISGRALADQLQSEAPGLKIICTSGYSHEALDTAWLQAADIRFLPKPYLPQTLLKTVSEHLGPPKTEVAP